MTPFPLLLLATALVTAALPGNAQRSARPRDIQISRDEYGIAHVHGRSDADAVFGFAYAQAEDNFFRIEEDFILAIGRAAEVRGERALFGDRLNRALGVEAASRAEYKAMPPRIRALVDAYAAGVTRYLATHPSVKPRLLTKIEPWYPLAFIRYNYFQQGFAQDGGLRGSTFQTDLKPLTAGTREPFPLEPRLPRGLASNVGSNGWVVGPSRSASGYPLLFINPHLSFFGSGQVYEGHVQSDEGWNFTGYTRFGFPFPYVGHNSSLGWVSTDNAADLADTYEETFDDPQHPLAYRYGTGYRIATERTDTIRVSTDRGMEARAFRFVRTHHGPILGARNGKLLAIRMAHFDDEGWLAEWYAMTKARTVKQLRSAMRPQKMLFGNVMAADSLGHIWYLYNGAVPRRDPSFAWGGAVDGSNPRTEWKGYHSIDELPELLDPATGWMQNCNTSPFHLTSSGNPDSLRFPTYMVRESMNPRGVRAMQILGGQPKFTFDEWTKLAFDTRIVMADSLLPKAIPAMRATSLVQSRADLREALDTLERWNHRGDTMSVATTVFTMWREWEQRARGNNSANDLTARALELAVDSLKGRAGTWMVPWGALNRLRRPDEASGETPFTAVNRPSVGVPGTNGSDGAVFTFYTQGASGLARYGGSGGTYISVVEFGPTVRALAVHTFGASGDPSSPHFFDQAPLYARGQFRGAWLSGAEVKLHAQRTYKP